MILRAPTRMSWLAKAPRPTFVAYASAAAFATYFCMDALRKPFVAARFDGQHFPGAVQKGDAAIGRRAHDARAELLIDVLQAQMPAADADGGDPLTGAGQGPVLHVRV